MRNKAKVLWWAALGLLLVTAALRVFLPVKSPVEFEQDPNNGDIVVYITGAVRQPGMLRLALDARMDDALKAAQVTSEADLDMINPAQKLKDGQKIIIPAKKTAMESQKDTEPGSTTDNRDTSSSSSEKVNINTADLAELDRIPGIGPALAKRIIDYRKDNGLYNTPEDLKNVSGIGEKTYEKMSGYLTVGQ
ncbi:competence protein ComEA helix-hairpin-helix repeat protein [Syntrophobotulus glycolicus DSM 8271]|uniref:Competence protein ComEA helix-hairpin-helix repeat protein n=1 Tax=Syntrophobotulus glycolicus (strain DSM 8271 / FlGlyR) TaxID=645991 RepID=F0SVG2_SYNGF|nr:helix-hairpin-helix domain-containing protein [Syntrophobotulus glycolicus]ADY56735.1 competence protein ComEA helix-hairpin-helix repeat protein [Syntrophobotulus glycolicus DSM 8271]